MNFRTEHGWLLIALATVSTVAVAGERGGDADAATVTAAQACASLANRTIGAATVVAAAEVAASNGLPAYCKISAKILPALNFELRIPQRWNGKVHYGGGGGFNGYVPPLMGSNVAALKAGYINLGSDSGHQASGMDASWAIGNPHAEELYAYLSVPTVMSSSLEMIKAAYGRAPDASYFEGCSNGGREGLMMAQRYPNLFDGIIAGCPVLGMPGLVGTYHRTAKALAAVPGEGFTAAQVKLLADAVLAACDSKDGILDGVIANPAACDFKPRTLRCRNGADTGGTCLSDAQLAVVTSWTTPAAFADGAIRYPGFALSGGEGDRGSWDALVLGPKAALSVFQDTGIKSLVERNLDVNPLAYDYDSNPAALSRWSALMDPTDTDLRPFGRGGGKLIMWHGGADASLSARLTSDYYGRVVAAAGGPTNADSFIHYFVLPGVNHCGRGRGADSVDLLSALDRWVQEGKAPAGLTVAKLAADGSTEFTRPICKYPQYPRYTGPAKDAAAARMAGNYTCTTP